MKNKIQKLTFKLFNLILYIRKLVLKFFPSQSLSRVFCPFPSEAIEKLLF